MPDFLRIVVSFLLLPVAIGLLIVGVMALTGGGISETSLMLLAVGIAATVGAIKVFPRLD